MKNAHIGDLKPDRNNARRHPERNISLISRSLESDGFGRSILLDAGGNIIAGNGVTEASGNVGIEDVIIVPSDGTKIIAIQRTDVEPGSERAVRLAIADNRAQELSDFDPAVVAALAEEVDLSDFWRDDELDALLAGLETEQEAAGDDPGVDFSQADAHAAQLGIAVGQTWMLGAHRLIVGDCTDPDVVASLMDGRRADAVLTDPPYGINQPGVPHDEPEHLEELMKGAIAALPCDDAVVIAFQSTRTFPAWLDAARAAGHTFERMLWMYKAAQMTFPWRGWIMKSESILATTIGKGQWQDVKPYSHDCYYLSEVSGQLSDDLGWHGSVKPLSVVADLLVRICPPGGIVYEPFLGSGTTMIAAEQEGRACYCAEIEPRYAAVSIKRWEGLTGAKAVCLEDARDQDIPAVIA